MILNDKNKMIIFPYRQCWKIHIIPLRYRAYPRLICSNIRHITTKCILAFTWWKISLKFSRGQAFNRNRTPKPISLWTRKSNTLSHSNSIRMRRGEQHIRVIRVHPFRVTIVCCNHKKSVVLINVENKWPSVKFWETERIVQHMWFFFKYLIFSEMSCARFEIKFFLPRQERGLARLNLSRQVAVDGPCRV